LSIQNLITPVGTQKIGTFEYTVNLNTSPIDIAAFNDLPIKTVNGTVIYMRDVADVHDGSPPQTNVVHVDGKSAVLLAVVKAGAVSTLSIISGIKQLLPSVAKTLPVGLNLAAVGDQSVFVTSAVSSVVREGVIAAALTGLMILLFLGSWRSTLIITISIPLAILASLTMLSVLGETINVMTLGGLALAVAILVDDATVTIENINWHLEHGKEIETAISGRRAADRCPCFRIVDVHLPRFRTNVRPRRCGGLSLPPAGRSSRVCAGRLLHPVAHAGTLC
jgi:multidrug efflux pump subunit AcrB